MDKLDALLSKFEEPKDEMAPEEEKPFILVVDDDESMRRGIKASLSQRYNVITAENGKSAIERFIDNQFYAVVLDIKMPGMSGFEVCQELSKRNPDIPIIFYTAFQGEHDLQAILNIYKPFAYLDKGRSTICLRPYAGQKIYSPVDVEIGGVHEMGIWKRAG